MTKILIYGAAGYTGKLISERAREAGLDFEIAGRNEAKVAALARELGVPYRVFGVEDASALRAGLEGMTAVLNCAGPFARTARPMMEACIAVGAHYLDITAEFKVYELAEEWSQRAADAGVMLLPGVGWDVVPSDCLAMYVAAKVDQPQRLRMALQVAGSVSRGSATSVAEILGVGLLVRADGAILATPDAQAARFDFGDGDVDCFPLSFGDLITAWKSTRIPNIEMFVHVKGDGFPAGDLAAMPDGPSAAERDAHRASVVAEVTGADGAIFRARIDTVNGYSYTPLSAVEAARRVLAGEHRAGFQTPATLFGAAFAESIADTAISDL
ncbi:saccharopine dehydrogenase family protein [Duganella aceris]|uniref:NAD(P)H-binding protein n=1 Tax=Duganella aceris TaxID=2703883 RepID=A0ABX0FN61_9BURK|nr:saccharopine dehydrogenase NADP-binding domain-containing protein [Duganella aceris]NGZ85928.1 NAD(P)H-binding protein [Duganella aceris]